MPVARKVVAFAKLAGNLFFSIFTVATLALAANTIAAVVAYSRGCVIRAASGLQVAGKLQILGTTFARLAVISVRALADTAFVCTYVIAAGRFLLIPLVS